MKIMIRGHVWKVYLLDEETFISKFDDGTAALTAPKERMLFFQPDYIDLPTVIHEVFHAYISHGGLESANLSVDQVEEVHAELVGTYGVEMIALSRRIRKELLKKAKSL
jgi:hypothetical protein